MKRSLASLVLGFACIIALSVPVLADGGSGNSDPVDPPGETSPSLLEAVVLDALQSSWSFMWSVIA